LQEPPNAGPNKAACTKAVFFSLKPSLQFFSSCCPHPSPIAWAIIPHTPRSPQPSSNLPTLLKKNATPHPTGTSPANSLLFFARSPNQTADYQNH
jgi:hypothetical protein